MATVTTTIDKLAADMNRTAAEMEKAFKSESLRRKLSIMAVAGVKDNFAQGRSPQGVPWRALRMRQGKPLLDTGRMRASIAATTTPAGFTIGTTSVQARIHNEGGTIRAKKKFLAIPLTQEARRAGSPRNIPDLHFVGKKGANSGILANAEGEAVFALTPSVVIPKREFMGLSVKTMEQIERLIQDEIAKALGG